MNININNEYNININFIIKIKEDVKKVPISAQNGVKGIVFFVNFDFLNMIKH